MNIGKIYNKIFDYNLRKIKNFNFEDIIYNNINKNPIPYSTKFIKDEIPIRMAQRIADLNNLPFGLNQNHSISKIREWYVISFSELLNDNKKIYNKEEEYNDFKEIIKKIYNRHSPTIITMSKGILELKKENKITDIYSDDIQNLLNRFYKNRTELRILLQQYLSLFENENIINHNLNPLTIINTALNNIQLICDYNRINLNINDITKINNTQINFIGIENYIYYILFEILKNSVDAINKKLELNLFNPELLIEIKDIDKNWFVIKIKDNGIGIKQECLDKIWYYSYSSNPIDIDSIVEKEDFNNNSPLSGYGYGLPISDLYLSFFNNFNNNIRIHSRYMEGTTVYIHIRKYNI